MLTLNQIVKIVSDFAGLHTQINSFHFAINPFKEPNSPEYPNLLMELTASDIIDNVETYTFDFLLIDIVSDDNREAETIETLSDTKLMANDVIAFLKYKVSQVNIDLPVNLEPIQFGGSDGFVGWRFSIRFKIPQGLDACVIPMTGSVVVNTSVVRIRNQDGTIIHELTAPNDYFVEELRAIIDTIDNNTVTIIDPIV